MLSRRQLLGGIAATVACIPVLPKLSFADESIITEVDAANQYGYGIIVHPLRQEIHTGDIVTFDGVGAINRYTKHPLGVLNQFVITHNAPKGDRIIHIWPALWPPLSSFTALGIYQTVDANVKNRAKVRLQKRRPLSFSKISKDFIAFGEPYLKPVFF